MRRPLGKPLRPSWRQRHRVTSDTPSRLLSRAAMIRSGGLSGAGFVLVTRLAFAFVVCRFRISRLAMIRPFMDGRYQPERRASKMGRAEIIRLRVSPLGV